MYIQVKVAPRSSKTEFVEHLADGTIKIRLKAAPEKGKANVELRRFLSKSLGIPKSEIKIISGHSSQTKLLRIPKNTLLPW